MTTLTVVISTQCVVLLHIVWFCYILCGSVTHCVALLHIVCGSVTNCMVLLHISVVLVYTVQCCDHTDCSHLYILCVVLLTILCVVATRCVWNCYTMCVKLLHIV